MCIYLVKNDSKGDKLLFRYPYTYFGGPQKVSCDLDKVTSFEDPEDEAKRRHQQMLSNGFIPKIPDSPQLPENAEPKHQLADYTDEVLSNLFAVKSQLCDQKFELKVDHVRFISHPLEIQTCGGDSSKPESPSNILLNVVFALDAFARRQIADCYHNLSKAIGVALRHEENRCGYLSNQIKEMVYIHDTMTTGSDCSIDLDASYDHDPHFEKICKTCTLAKDIKKVFDEVTTTGVVNLKVNNWIEVSFCLPHKVHNFYKDRQLFDPASINTCLKQIRPYHGILLMCDRRELLDKLPQDTSPSMIRLINMYSPVKSLQTLSADADLTLAQVFSIAGHLIYWGNAIIIFPLCETNLYAIAPNVPTTRNNKLAREFAEKFPGYNLLKVMSEYSFPTALEYKMGLYDDKSSEAITVRILIWLLQHKILQQYHTYIYFMPSSKGLPFIKHLECNNSSQSEEENNDHQSEEPMAALTLSENWWKYSGDYSSSMSCAEEMYLSLDLNEQYALMNIPASANPDDFRLLMRLLKQGYLSGEHHIEEIMYLENIRRMELYLLLEKFKDVLLLVEMEDPTLQHFYSHT
ncbi:Hypothetical protein CINCED_3A017105 [Cinara cedri]|nr:Hypothetical protein CINCED_3A017105 [Cinara cedri]